MQHYIFSSNSLKMWGLSLISLLAFPACRPTLGSSGDPKIEKLKMPAGFHVEKYAENVDNARSLCLTASGILFVGTRDAGNVYALKDENGDGKADQRFTIAKNLEMPNGVAFRNGSLFVAEVNRIIRFDSIESKLANPPKPVVVNDSLPDERSHGWKYIAFGPDDKLYVPVGAPCNICERTDDKRFASILRMNPDGTGMEVYASGVRNTVGFDWEPTTREMWFTENGRDWLGDDAPHDELNYAPKQGTHFGFPYCHAGEVADPDFGSKFPCSNFEKPAKKLGAHVAALGMEFYSGNMFPPEYKNKIFICEHGSWNRSTPSGYQVSVVTLENGKPVHYEPFISGWLEGNKAWGRPVDIAEMPDGSLLISDDHANTIYRLTYSK